MRNGDISCITWFIVVVDPHAMLNCGISYRVPALCSEHDACVALVQLLARNETMQYVKTEHTQNHNHNHQQLIDT